MAHTSSRIRIIDYATIKGGAWRPEQISNDMNALGGAPAPILYLWVFERPDSLSGQLISHGWVQLGPLHVLVSADARTDDELITNKAQLRERLSRFSYDAGAYRSPRFADLEFYASYRGYPINTLWCSDAIWQMAFLEVTRRSRYFVVDVTAEQRPTGLSFELGHLFASVPSTRIVLLMDRYRADQDEVISLLSKIWEDARKGKSPESKEPPPLITYSSAQLRYLVNAALRQWTGRPAIPLAHRVATYTGWWCNRFAGST